MAYGMRLLASYRLLLTVLTSSFINVYGTYAFSYVSNSVVRDLRQEAFSNMQKLNMTYFDTHQLEPSYLA